MNPSYIIPGALFAASLHPLLATVTSVGVDSTTAANWRTAANVTFQADNQYGTSGYVVFGLNEADSVYTNFFDISSANPKNAYNLPAGISLTTADTNINMWSGNGNFGFMQDPGAGNALATAGLLANSAGPRRFTISRSHTTPMRLTLMTASGDGAGVAYTPSVNDGSGAVSTNHTHTVNGVVYHVFDISGGTSDIVVNITSFGQNWSLTGMAFDEVLPPPVIVNWITDGNGNWSESANWDAAVPNAASANARLSSPPLTGPAMVTLDVPVTLGSLVMSGANPYTVAGANSLTLDNGGFDSVVNVAGGLHEISAPVVLVGNTAVNPAAGSELTISGTLTGTATFGIGASGTVNLSGDFSAFTGVFSINNSGVLEINPAAPLTLNNLISGNGSLRHSGTGLVTLTGPNTAWTGGLVVTGGGSVSAGSSVALGTGPVTLADGTLTITGDSNLGARNLPIGSGNGSLVIPTGVTVTSRAPAPAGGGELVKSGTGAWVIPLGVGTNTFRLDVSEGSADLSAVDAYGAAAFSDLTLRIGPGSLVTNGAAAPAFQGFNAMTALELEGGELRATNGISVVNPFLESGLFEAYGIRNSIVVTGTAPSLISDVGQAEGAINIGGIVDLGGGFNAPVNIDVEDVTTNTASDLIVSAKLQDNGSVSFARLKSGIVKSGTGTLELSGVNIFTGNTQVDEGALLLAASGRLLFVLGDTSGISNQLSGAGAATIEGDFAIEIAAAAALSSGSWTLENVPSLAGPYGVGFQVTDPDGTPWVDAGSQTWTKDGGGGKTWTFSELTGVLQLAQTANFASWAIDNGVTGGADGDSDFDGIPNLIEYALNLNFAGSDGSAGTFNDNLLSFTKRAVAVTNGDITYAIQESDDLGVGDLWATVTPTLDDTTTITYQLPVGPGPRKFARLLITQISP